MKKYRKKPIVIEAVKYTGRNLTEIKEWCPKALKKASDLSVIIEGDRSLIIETLEGDMRLRAGDYLIKGIANEYYPCKNEVFIRSYEEV